MNESVLKEIINEYFSVHGCEGHGRMNQSDTHIRAARSR